MSKEIKCVFGHVTLPWCLAIDGEVTDEEIRRALMKALPSQTGMLAFIDGERITNGRFSLDKEHARDSFKIDEVFDERD